MDCIFGRSYDENHPTCVTCPEISDACKKKSRKKTKAAAYTATPVTSFGIKTLVCSKDLRTPNDWTNKKNGKRIYVRERQEWEKLFTGVVFFWGKQKPGIQRRLTITRYVPNSNHLMKDRTNLEGSCKPVEDALQRVGVLIDDDLRHLLRDTPRQEIGDPRVEITLEDVEA